MQKKTFQKWVNSHLVRVGCRIGDLYVDMRDGKNLIKLLEVLSGERLVNIFRILLAYQSICKNTIFPIIWTLKSTCDTLNEKINFTYAVAVPQEKLKSYSILGKYLIECQKCQEN